MEDKQTKREAYNQFYISNFSYKGRANKHQFLNSFLWNVVLLIGVLAIVHYHQGHEFSTKSIYAGASVIFWVSFLPYNTHVIRRLHDTGRSGWWSLLSLIPMIGSVSMLFLLLQPSEKRTNKWGDCPK